MATSMHHFTRLRWTLLLVLVCAAGLSCRAREASQPGPTPPTTDTESPIYERTIVAPLDATAAEIRSALDDAGFEIVSQADVGLALAKHADTLGPEYNRSGLDGIRSLSVCHPHYANRGSNADPATLALCPLQVTLFSKDDETTIVFVRPTSVVRTPSAIGAARELEQALLGAIQRATASRRIASSAGECRFDFECRGDHVCDRHTCVRWWKLNGVAPEVTAEELATMVRDGDVQVLDVRTSVEFRRGHIEGAHSVPLGDLGKDPNALPVSREGKVVAICLTAHRSVAAVRLLKRLGYEVLQLEGGMQAWRAAKLPEVAGPYEAASAPSSTRPSDDRDP